MPHIISKTIQPKKKDPLRVAVDIIIIVLAIPVVIIASCSLLLYFLFMKIKVLLFHQRESPNDAETYHYETMLLDNGFVNIMLSEDEMDTELTSLNHLWAEQVYNKETYLYRAKTNPLIAALENKICCFYLDERPEGALLQVMAPAGNDVHGLLHTRLVYLRYSDLQTFVVDEVGPYFLYNDNKNNQLIRGFSEKEAISIQLSW